MAMGPFKSLNSSYFQLGTGNDTTADSATYVRLTNVSASTAYDIKVRTTANDNSTTVGSTVIAKGESFILKKDPAEFVHAPSGNIYASPISPRE
mgnify:CR=1 FL=1|tara:strand:+ start:398 stop:679 length:282 start_codon:yes stop_codon:yes gene_type:complete